jgi:hypothetical protein
MAEQQPQPVQQKGFFERMSLFQKFLIGLIVILIILIAVGTFFGGYTNFYQFTFNVIILVGIGVFLFIIISATGILFTPKAFSPRSDMKTTLIKMAQYYLPDNLNDLYFIGTGWKRRVLAGKIIGILGLPNYIGDIELDKEGKPIYTTLEDAEGKKIPKFKNIRVGKDGDTLFLVRKGWFIFAKTRMIRAKRELHSVLHGDVEIYDINPVPYGFFEYPFKQMQKNIGAVLIQNQIETILSAHEHQHDLISQSVDSAVWYNPYMRMALKSQSEIPTGVEQ